MLHKHDTQLCRCKGNVEKEKKAGKAYPQTFLLRRPPNSLGGTTAVQDGMEPNFRLHVVNGLIAM